ncbi:hypothetical protein [Myxococcus phage Mx1]|nr:hypothetical protein [Myxococcus phage Mx1]
MGIPFVFHPHIEDHGGSATLTITCRRGLGANTYYVFKQAFKAASMADQRRITATVEKLLGRMREAAASASWYPQSKYWTRVECIDEVEVLAPTQSRDDHPW